MVEKNGSEPPKKRAASRDINYAEGDPDAELMRENQLIESLEHNNAPKIKKSRKNEELVKYQDYLNDKFTSWNFVPNLPPSFRKTSRFANFIELEGSMVNKSRQCLFSDEGELLKANDTIYMVSEPPGEPYYIGRIVEFVCKPEFKDLVQELEKYTTEIPSKYFQLKMNWYYRPRDIHAHTKSVGPRLVYASLHHDVCPITSYRGKCTVIHSNEVPAALHNKIELVTKDNVFYFDQLFDRHSLKYYDVYPTDTVLTFDSKSSFLYYLAKRFHHVYVEEGYPLEKVLKRYCLGDEGQGTEDNSWDYRCTTCREWCASSQCLKCDECQCAVHLACMEPPLPRKPNKGIVWLCYICLRRQEGTVESLNEVIQEEQLDKAFIEASKSSLGNLATQRVQTEVPILRESTWFQYMGQYLISHMKDLLDDNLLLPFPFKTSRVGLKYQWLGCSDPEKWHPRSYSSDDTNEERGKPSSAELNWRLDGLKITPDELDDYVRQCREHFPIKLSMSPESCNFLDMILKILMECDYDQNLALKLCETKLTRESLKEPTLSPDEVKQFEEGVAKHGSELNLVSECVPTQPLSMIVRFYYHWKKTPNGRAIWGNFKGRSKNRQKKSHNNGLEDANNRKSNRERKPTKLALQSDVCKFQRDYRFIDESCFDVENMPILKDYFHCQFCKIDFSPMWYKVTGGFDEEEDTAEVSNAISSARTGKSKTKAKNDHRSLDALCIRCARLWRRYGVKWEPPMEVFKRLTGANNSNLQALLGSILDEENMNILKTPPQQAGEKLVEWELVIDAELLARQRLILTRQPNTFVKYKRHSAASRTRLYKMVKRPYDREAYSIENLRNELKEYLKRYNAQLGLTINDGSDHQITQ